MIIARSEVEALDQAACHEPVLIILDVRSDSELSIEACGVFRSRSETFLIPMIVLLSECRAAIKIRAFELGADDCVTKPYLAKELLARVAAKIRREQERRSTPFRQSQSRLQLGSLMLDFEARKVEISGQRIDLGNIEVRILHCLLKSHGKLVSREELNEYVWDSELPSERALDPHINSLRKKLRLSHLKLHMSYGKGYFLSEENVSQPQNVSSLPVSV